MPDDQGTILSDSVSRRSDPRLAGSIFSEARTIDTSLTSVTTPSITGRIGHNLRVNVAGSRSTSVDQAEVIGGTSVYRNRDKDDNRPYSRDSSKYRTPSVADHVEKVAARPRIDGTKVLDDQRKGRQPEADQEEEHDVGEDSDTVAKDFQMRRSSGRRIFNDGNNKATPATLGFYEDNTMTSMDVKAYEEAHAAKLPTTTMPFDTLEQREISEAHDSYIYRKTWDGHGTLLSETYGAQVLNKSFASEATEDLPGTSPGTSRQGYDFRQTHWSSLPEPEEPAAPEYYDRIEGRAEGHIADYEIDSRKWQAKLLHVWLILIFVQATRSNPPISSLPERSVLTIPSK